MGSNSFSFYQFGPITEMLLWPEAALYLIVEILFILLAWLVHLPHPVPPAAHPR